MNGGVEIRELDIPLSLQARAMVRKYMTSAEAIDGLVREGMTADLLLCIAYSMPLRDTIWWAALCVWNGLEERPSDVDDNVLGTAVRWAVEPTEDRRLAAQFAANESATSPLSALAAAAARAFDDAARAGTSRNCDVRSAASLAVTAILSSKPSGDLKVWRMLADDVACGRARWKTPGAA